jgi:hypothetical protein
MSSQTKKQVLRDLAERMGRADRELCAMARVAAENDNYVEAQRLMGKVQGVRLALSYVEEVQR